MERNMSIASILKRVTKALPAILVAVPNVLDAVRQVQEALKKPKKPADGGAEATTTNGAAAAPRQLSADSGQGAR
jgi:hypothetical protein